MNSTFLVLIIFAIISCSSCNENHNDCTVDKGCWNFYYDEVYWDFCLYEEFIGIYTENVGLLNGGRYSFDSVNCVLQLHHFDLTMFQFKILDRVSDTLIVEDLIRPLELKIIKVKNEVHRVRDVEIDSNHHIDYYSRFLDRVISAKIRTELE